MVIVAVASVAGTTTTCMPPVSPWIASAGMPVGRVSALFVWTRYPAWRARASAPGPTELC